VSFALVERGLVQLACAEREETWIGSLGTTGGGQVHRRHASRLGASRTAVVNDNNCKAQCNESDRMWHEGCTGCDCHRQEVTRPLRNVCVGNEDCTVAGDMCFAAGTTGWTATAKATAEKEDERNPQHHLAWARFLGKLQVVKPAAVGS
jgi:hypothetical protein